MDDFEYDDPEQNDDSDGQRDQGSIKDRVDNIKDKSDDIKEKVDKAREYRQKSRAARESGKSAGTEAGKETGKAAGKEAGKAAGKEAGKEAGKTVAKEGAKTAAKETGKVVAKEGAKTAAKGAVAASGVATAGVGTAVAAAIEVADRVNQINNKINDKIKEKYGVDIKKTKKTIKRSVMVSLILLPLMIFFALFIFAGTLFLASEDTYEDLYAIIGKREKRYAESGKTSKLLMLMTNEEINEILTKDYGKDDLCYKTYLKEMYKKDFDNFIPSDTDDPNSTYAEKVAIIEKYLKAGRENFNKINWKLEGSKEKLVVKSYDLTGKNTLGDPGFLKMPDLDKYKSSPGMTQEQIKNMYIDMVHIYLQHWVIPYALNIASQDNSFGKSVLEDMWHPIDVTLFELDRRTKTTTEKHYIKTSIKETIATYTPGPVDPDTGIASIGTTSYTYRTFPSDTRTDWTTSTNGNVTYSYEETKLKNARGGCISIDEENPYSKTPVTVDEPYRHVPKATYIEGLYNIITEKFKIIPIDESKPPVEKFDSLIDENGIKTKIEIWDEDLESVSQKTEKYKLSYLPDTRYTSADRTINRIEWYLDAGRGEYEMYPTKDAATKKKIYDTYYSPDGGKTRPKIQSYSYDDLTFGFVQIDKYYQQLKGATASGVSSSSIDIGDIPADGFAWPVDLNQSPNSAVVGYLYGYTNAYGGNHTGIDIRNGGTLSNQGNLTVGPTIVAAHDGVVEEAKLIYTSNSSGIDGNQSGYGNVVKIKTEDGKFMTVYGHLSTISVITGQKVTRGQVIGTMGTTGNSSGVHLHYEIRQDGSTKDPLLFYTTDPVYGSYPTREDTPAGYYRYTGSISSGISNTAASAGLLGFLTSFEGEGPKVGDKYQAYDDGFGNITIGAGITWKDHKSQFNAAGIYSMAEGDLVDISIVDNIKKNDIAGRVANIKSVLESNGITDLKQYQIDALTSFHYNVGNIDDFPAAWKKYGTGDGLWTEFFSKHIYASGEVVQGLVNRRKAEFELFTTGNYGL